MNSLLIIYSFPKSRPRITSFFRVEHKDGYVELKADCALSPSATVSPVTFYSVSSTDCISLSLLYFFVRRWKNTNNMSITLLKSIVWCAKTKQFLIMSLCAKTFTTWNDCQEWVKQFNPTKKLVYSDNLLSLKIGMLNRNWRHASYFFSNAFHQHASLLTTLISLYSFPYIPSA